MTAEMGTDVGAQLRKGVVEFCILGLLSAEPTYGWKLSEILVSNGLIASIGTLYPVLTRLRTQGLVTTYDLASESGPARRYYRLTTAGIDRLTQFRQQWGPFARTVHHLVGEETP